MRDVRAIAFQHVSNCPKNYNWRIKLIELKQNSNVWTQNNQPKTQKITKNKIKTIQKKKSEVFYWSGAHRFSCLSCDHRPPTTDRRICRTVVIHAWQSPGHLEHSLNILYLFCCGACIGIKQTTKCCLYHGPRLGECAIWNWPLVCLCGGVLRICFMHEKDADFYLFQQDLYVSVTFVYTKYDEDGKFCVLFPIESAS